MIDFTLSEKDEKVLAAVREEALVCRKYARYYDDHEEEFAPAELPEAKWHQWDAVPSHARAGAVLAFGEPVETRYHFDKADVVVVTGIPPVDEQLSRFFNLDAIESYSAALASVCARSENCIYQDPYKDLRIPGESGLAKPGAMADGLHAKSYREIYERLPLCTILAAAQE